MTFDDPAARDAYRNGVREALDNAFIHLEDFIFSAIAPTLDAGEFVSNSGAVCTTMRMAMGRGCGS